MAKDFLKRFISIAALFLLPSLAWALPTPKDVTEQMSAGNVAQAESLTREILRERPDSAKAHYYLGQILTTKGNYKDAYAELTKATQLDKSLSFASSESRFRGEMRKVEVNLGKVAAPQATNETHAGRTLLIILASLAAIGGIAWVINARISRKEKQARDADRKKKLADQTSQIMALLEKAASLEIAVKLSDDPGKKLAALAGVKDELNDLLTRNRKQKALATDWSLTRIERSLRRIETGETVPPISSIRPRPSMPQTQPQPQTSVPPQPAPSQPQVTNNYVSGGSNNGLVEGMMLGEMMSDRHETRVERVVERERDDDNDRSSLDESRSSFDSGSSSSFDSGSGSSFDSGSSSDSNGGSDW